MEEDTRIIDLSGEIDIYCPFCGKVILKYDEEFGEHGICPHVLGVYSDA